MGKHSTNIMSSRVIQSFKINFFSHFSRQIQNVFENDVWKNANFLDVDHSNACQKCAKVLVHRDGVRFSN